MAEPGTVYLVGAGPGDAGLLTCRGAELLQKATLVVYDALVNPGLLALAPADAEILYAGKRASAHAIPQEDLNQLLVEKAGEGGAIVRLKGGDPLVFGRGGEEAAELKAAGIPFEIVPGISSAMAAPAYAGIPVTHRDHCSSFTVITGHEQPGKDESSIDWEKLAKETGTRIILMGVDRIRAIAGRLQENGLPGETPVAMVRWGTTGRQETLVGTLADIAEKVEQAAFKAPAVTIIGGVVNLREQLNWFENRQLFGRRIVVTRTRQQASQLSRRLAGLGADILEIPTIRIVPPAEKQPLMDAILGIASYDWLVFTSPNGVDQFFHWFLQTFDDIRSIGGCQIAAVGPATAAKLKQLHLRVDLMPEKYTAKAVAQAFKDHQNIENLTLCLLRAEVANPDLPKVLHEMGGIVDDIPIYRTVPESEDRNGAATRLAEEGADIITFTSSSTVENFHARFDLPRMMKKHNLQSVSIGPETTKALVKLGQPPAVEASPHNIEGMIEAVLSVSRK
ncbi:MAG: uroporphyrinogen-III C-methyltransferase [Verrucomicrobiales bacterium]|nr:uroporphyrinogen-III C-methyltransferase [Verrucomicrobiales bacterium]